MATSDSTTLFHSSALVKPAMHDSLRFTSTPAWASMECDFAPSPETQGDSDAENLNKIIQIISPPITALDEPNPILTSKTVPADETNAGDLDEDRSDMSSESKFVPSLYSPSEYDSDSSMDESEDHSTSIGSSDTYSTDMETESNSLSSFIASSDYDSDLSFAPSADSREDQKRAREVTKGTGSDASQSETEDEPPKKFRRLHLPPRSIYDKPEEGIPSTSSPALLTYVSIGESSEPIRPDFMIRAANSYLAKERYRPAYALSTTYKNRSKAT